MRTSTGAIPISRTPNTWMPGSWEPGRIQLIDALVIKVVLISVALIRGLDYLSPVIRETPAVETMQDSFPIQVWGVMMVVPALILALGLSTRTHIAVWLGHGLLAVVYLCLTVALGTEFLSRPWFDGIRNAGGLLTPITLHAIICLRTGWRPMRWSSPDDPEKGS